MGGQKICIKFLLVKNPSKMELKLVSMVKKFSEFILRKKIRLVTDIPIFPDIRESEGEKSASCIYSLSQIRYVSKTF